MNPHRRNCQARNGNADDYVSRQLDSAGMAALSNRCHVTNADTEARGEPSPMSQRNAVIGESELARLQAENAQLRELAGAMYQAAGAYEMPVRFLDALSSAAHGEKFDPDKLLPVTPYDWRSLVRRLADELRKPETHDGTVDDGDCEHCVRRAGLLAEARAATEGKH